ncbi:TetR/AcrR family transcriptional regulator [Ktedonobacter racemifer]|uniref:Transcriptional regulator, TetR family n=1 Tax=Ktedonobacter racemifer DSM 44963 TaxID=485913 RepID=D6TW32_KTERA|nr:TetR/AcrR family transcriptional regulator [Ktedonobacter racemifer]EFH84415.1 transcriptional regulator, TetR family [Ktedonobacter racemifer DSM 44963]
MAPRAGLEYDAIVKAAAELADEHGLHMVTMAMLAAHLGVRTPTLYHYFSGLAGLQRALALLGLQEMTEQLGQAIMGKAGDDAVVALAHTLRDFGRTRPGLYEATARAPEPGDAEWQEAGRRGIEIALRALGAYMLSQEDALHAVRMVRSLVHGCVTLETAGGFGLPLDVNETFKRLLDLLLHDLHTRQGSGK